MTDIKICGISDQPSLTAAIDGGVRYVGFVYYPDSPRHLTIASAGQLAARLPGDVTGVALSVNPDDELVERIGDTSGLDMLQLHGNESPERASEIRSRSGKTVMKAFRLSTESDLDAVDAYVNAVDMLLFDAKTPPVMVNAMPGGNAVSFDWRILSDRCWPIPWMLSGGLNPLNVSEAIRISGASAVDVSSGVESAPGVKDPDRIFAFIRAAEATTGFAS